MPGAGREGRFRALGGRCFDFALLDDMYYYGQAAVSESRRARAGERAAATLRDTTFHSMPRGVITPAEHLPTGALMRALISESLMTILLLRAPNEGHAERHASRSTIHASKSTAINGRAEYFNEHARKSRTHAY